MGSLQRSILQTACAQVAEAVVKEGIPMGHANTNANDADLVELIKSNAEHIDIEDTEVGADLNSHVGHTSPDFPEMQFAEHPPECPQGTDMFNPDNINAIMQMGVADADGIVAAAPVIESHMEPVLGTAASIPTVLGTEASIATVLGVATEASVATVLGPEATIASVVGTEGSIASVPCGDTPRPTQLLPDPAEIVAGGNGRQAHRPRAGSTGAP